MPDPYLMAAMQGGLSHGAKSTAKTKNKFDVAAEKYVDMHVEALHFEEEFAQDKLFSPQMRKAQLRAELLAALQFSELDKPLDNAFKLLFSEGLQYIDHEVYPAMIDQFKQMADRLEKLDPTQPEELHSWSTLSDAVLNEIAKMALTKYDEENYTPCMALFVLLTVLYGDNFEYWYRLGIAAQKSEEINLALKAYTEALKIEPELVGARLFSVECYLKIGSKQAAEEELEKAKSLKALAGFDEKWAPLLADLTERTRFLP